MQQERIITANSKRILVRSRAPRAGARQAIVLSHARFQVHTYLVRDADVPIPTGLKLYHYIRHTETFSSRMAMDQYFCMQYGGGRALPPVKEYDSSRLTKNYTLRPEPEFKDLRVPEVGAFDLILPLEIMRVRDLLVAANAGTLAYDALHFICCRAVRLSAAGLI